MPNNVLGSHVYQISQQNIATGNNLVGGTAQADVRGGMAKHAGSSNSESLGNVALNKSRTPGYGSKVVSQTSSSAGIASRDWRVNVSGTNATTPASFPLTKGQYEIKGVGTSTVGSPGNKIKQRDINYATAYRTYAVTSGIRAAYWNKYAGWWSTAPQQVTDSVNTDNEAETNPRSTTDNNGEFAYRNGSKLPIQDDYPRKLG